MLLDDLIQSLVLKRDELGNIECQFRDFYGCLTHTPDLFTIEADRIRGQHLIIQGAENPE